MLFEDQNLKHFNKLNSILDHEILQIMSREIMYEQYQGELTFWQTEEFHCQTGLRTIKNIYVNIQIHFLVIYQLPGKESLH